MFKKTHLVAVAAAAAFVALAVGATWVQALNLPPFTIKQGGTGTSTLPAYGQFLVGGKNGEWELVASSTVGGVNTVFGRKGAVTAQSGDYTTSLVTEGSNQYFTGLRVDAQIEASSSIPRAVPTSYGKVFVSSGVAWTAVSTSTLGISALDLTGVLPISKGGLNLSSAPAYGQLPVGTVSGGYSLTATSSLGLPTFGGLNLWAGTNAFATSTANVLNGEIVLTGTFPYTRDASGLQTAINVCSAVYLANGGCGSVYLPAGTYSIAPGSVALKSNVNLRGAGEATFVTEPNTLGAWNLFTGTGVSNVKISDIFFSGTNTSPIGTLPQNNTFAFHLVNSTNVIFENVRFEQFFEDIEGNNVSGASFTRIYDYSGGEGFGTQDLTNIDGLATSTYADIRCYASDTCIRLQGGAHDINITGSQFYAGSIEIGNAEGTRASQNINIVGNSWVGSVGYPITMINFSTTSVVAAGGGYNAGIRGVNIIGNTFDLATTTSFNYQAILGENSGFTGTTAIADVTIAHNTFVSNANAGVHGKTAMIEGVDGGVALRWNVSDNNIASSTGDAIKMFSPVDSKIHDNIAWNYGTNQNVQADEACIYVGGTSYATSSNTDIYQNHCSGPAAGGVTSSGIYIDNAAYVSSLQLGPNQLYNTTTKINYATVAPPFTSSTVFGKFGVGGDPLDTFTAQGGNDSVNIQTTGGGPRLEFGNGSTVNQYFQFGAYNNVNNLEGFNSRDLVFTQTGNEKMRLTNAGNLGIGTTTPGSLLSVGGVANFAAATSTFYSMGGINLQSGCVTYAGGACLTSNSGTVMSVGTAYPILGGPISNAGTISLAFGTTTPNIWGAANTFSATTTIGGAGSGAGLIFNGPQAVMNAMNAPVTLQRNGGSGEASLYLQSSAGTGGRISTAGGTGSLTFTNFNSGSEWARFTSVGKFGLATDSPETLFHMAGTGVSTLVGNLDTDLRLQTNTATANAGSEISFRGTSVNPATSTSVYAAIAAPVTSNGVSSSQGYLSFYTKLGAAMTLSEAMRIDANQRVMIATTTALSKFAVGGNTTIGADYNLAAPTNGILVEGSSGFGSTTPWAFHSVQAPDNSALPEFVVASSSLINFVVANTGNVGIGGPASATNKLQVGGSIGASGNLAISGTILNPTGSASTPSYGFASDASFNTGMYRPAEDTLSLVTGGADRLYVNSSGNVGIGTTNPGSKLEVQGTVAAQAFNATSTATSTFAGGLSVSAISIGSLSGIVKAIGGYVTTALVNLTSDVVGILPIANGGTNANGQVTNGVSYFDGSKITSGAGLVYTGSRLGVGATPLDTFSAIGASDSVNVQTGSGPRVLWGSSGTDNAYMSIGAYNSIDNIEDFGSRDLAFSQNSSEKMRLTVGGNLGIGTTTPAYTLDLYGGGLRLAPGGAGQPSCTATARGLFWITNGGAGVKDAVQVCAKDAADAYAWRTIY